MSSAYNKTIPPDLQNANCFLCLLNTLKFSTCKLSALSVFVSDKHIMSYLLRKSRNSGVCNFDTTPHMFKLRMRNVFFSFDCAREFSDLFPCVVVSLDVSSPRFT